MKFRHTCKTVESFAYNIRKTRKMRRITQAKLAELSGVNRVHICEIERCKRVPGLEIANKIANALKFNIEFVHITRV